MDIVAALFIEGLNMRQAPGGATRIDLQGVHFSFAAPHPPPVSLDPHLVVLVRAAADDSGLSALEVVFTKPDGSEVASTKQPVQVEPGKFGRQLVKAELTWDDYGPIEAHCSIDGKPPIVVPLTLLPPT
ncbi:MAG: hypothetical protein E6G17_11195 [Actinobacteria bacterium]|nr:MAG: hypothetical protein E6G17_11195 [Actinomycetota bacterium]